MDEGDKAWIKREARRLGVSMEEFVRSHPRKTETESRAKPSEVFKRFFGPEHGVELPPPVRYGYRPLDLGDGEEA